MSVEQVGRRVFYRPTGVVTAGQAVDLIDAVLRLAKAAGLRDALVDITRLTGFESPGPAFRRWAVRRWSHSTDRVLRIAFVARAEHICPRRTGLLEAAEIGLQAYVCEIESEAVSWLDVAERNEQEHA